jgi:molybdopterin/thiamine biosynthesis adenylyltransferase
MCALSSDIQVIKVIGLGGNFQLVNFLAFYIARSVEEMKMEVVDGGSYKIRHLDHELFTSLKNKTLATKERLLKEYSNLKIKAIPYYIGNARSVNSLLPEDVIKNGNILFCCVDNSASIRSVSIACAKLDDVVLIVSGIDGTDILVQIYLKVNGEEITPPIHIRNPFVANPKDQMPSEILRQGCVDEVRGDRPNLFSLMMAGSLSLCAFYSIMDHLNSGNIKKFDVVNVNFNIRQLKMRVEHLNSI